jgi:hypothetical protein
MCKGALNNKTCPKSPNQGLSAKEFPRHEEAGWSRLTPRGKKAVRETSKTQPMRTGQVLAAEAILLPQEPEDAGRDFLSGSQL